MGEKDSSKTRVQPFFEKIFDAKNADWIVSLLNAFDSGLARSMSENAGIPKYDTIDKYFERKLAPPERFLEWLILNPSKLKWPMEDSNEREFGSATQDKRKALLEAKEEIQKEAFQNLKQYGAEQSYKKWWAFEGFTSVDCLIETDKILLAVEGKRTEKGPSESVSWYPQRNQLIRNLETLQQYAQGRSFAVVMIDEKGNYQFDDADIKSSLPHFTEEERKELISHFLGAFTWKEVCLKTGVEYSSLPDTV